MGTQTLHFFIHTCMQKLKPTATSSSHVITKFVPQTNMPTKLVIYAMYAKYFTSLWRACMHKHMTHMKPMAPTIQQEALYIYFTYITEQILLPHSEYSSHGQHTIWAYRPNIFTCLWQKTSNFNFYFTSYCQICVPKKICPSNWALCHICQILDMPL